ncbi:hypothetical protein QBC38DRAFT_447055 [Podospora fimiseda]|uniref:Uncharacterized protein n=1 Tax=Podospora fimiseda TaxID=252190 RepID=A0AAN7GPB4_9PEZI|nr:hypothetical protein QBC38DRAFT_447055 [Podospora fimiseda]
MKTPDIYYESREISEDNIAYADEEAFSSPKAIELNTLLGIPGPQFPGVLAYTPGFGKYSISDEETVTNTTIGYAAIGSLAYRTLQDTSSTLSEVGALFALCPHPFLVPTIIWELQLRGLMRDVRYFEILLQTIEEQTGFKRDFKLDDDQDAVELEGIKLKGLLDGSVFGPRNGPTSRPWHSSDQRNAVFCLGARPLDRLEESESWPRKT